MSSESKPYNEPKLVLSRIYTRGGDKGVTSLVNGRRVSKADARIEAYGTVDELNAVLGAAQVSLGELRPRFEGLARLAAILERVQHELFNLGSELATDPGQLHPKQPRITASEVRRLEAEIDAMNAELPALRSFVLPGGSRLNAELHLGRTVCRRAERRVVALGEAGEVSAAALEYLNRLSDALFVWSRWVNRELGAPEVLWQPNLAASSAAGEAEKAEG
jgi:cob(I)alamin adenosyltransferase